MLTACCLVSGLIGCSERSTRFRIVNYPADGGSASFHQEFDECYYCFDGHQNLEIIAKRASRTDNEVPTTQVVHIRTFWLPRPGITYAEPTMINATVSYQILVGPDGATFGGSGFLSFKEKLKKGILTAHLELSSLSPQRRVGQGERLFERATLEGELFANRDRQKVLEIVNQMSRTFGPMPDFEKKPENPDLH